MERKFFSILGPFWTSFGTSFSRGFRRRFKRHFREVLDVVLDVILESISESKQTSFFDLKTRYFREYIESISESIQKVFRNNLREYQLRRLRTIYFQSIAKPSRMKRSKAKRSTRMRCARSARRFQKVFDKRFKGIL